MKLFDHFDRMTVKKEDFDINNDEHTKSYNNHIINKFISSEEIFIPLVNNINRYDVPKDVHYNYYKSKLPKRKHYFKNVKGKKEVDDATRELICEYYQCSNGELEYHLQILTEEQIKNITQLYKFRK